jgi:hypothetical protein
VGRGEFRGLGVQKRARWRESSPSCGPPQVFEKPSVPVKRQGKGPDLMPARRQAAARLAPRLAAAFLGTVLLALFVPDSVNASTEACTNCSVGCALRQLSERSSCRACSQNPCHLHLERGQWALIPGCLTFGCMCALLRGTGSLQSLSDFVVGSSECQMGRQRLRQWRLETRADSADSALRRLQPKLALVILPRPVVIVHSRAAVELPSLVPGHREQRSC